MTVTELTYQRTENNQTAFFTVIAKTFQNSSWAVYDGEKRTGPSQIYSVYKKGNLLFINNELFELGRPGFCRDGEDLEGKFEMCILEILPQLIVNPLLTFDSVFIFEKKYEGNDNNVTRSYISSSANLLVKKEKRDAFGRVTVSEELFSIVKK